MIATPMQIALEVLGMAIFGGVALIGFNRFVASARETVVDQNIVTAAQALQRAYDEERSDLTSGAVVTTGAAIGLALDLLAARTDGLTWENDWGNISDANPADPTVVRIEFIETDYRRDGATNAARSAARVLTPASAVDALITGTVADDSPAAAPEVAWIATRADAACIWLGDGDGNWACALIVDRPNFDYVNTNNPRLNRGSAGATSSPFGSPPVLTWLGFVTPQEAALEIRGIWYNSGQRTDLTAASVLHDCSPVSEETANDKSRLPDGNEGGWDLSRGAGAAVELTRTLG